MGTDQTPAQGVRPVVLNRFMGWACPNQCGNPVSKITDGAGRATGYVCGRCHVDAVEVEYVTLRASDFDRHREDFENALSALKVIGRPGENYGLSDRLARSVALAAYVDLAPASDEQHRSTENEEG